MSVDLSLLSSTLGRALAILPYGGPGTRKSFGIHTLPPPIFMADFEGGAQSVVPWIRRQRKWNSQEWVEASYKDRQEAFDMLSEENKKYVGEVSRILPKPYIDVVFYDNMDVESYATYIKDVGNFDTSLYKSYALDSLKEFSEDIRTMAKGRGQELNPMNPSLWGGVQDRTGALCRYLRNFRDKGVFIYLTSGEEIDKVYLKDPREKRPAGEAAPEPISTKGNISMFGRMPGELQHLVDIQLHARAMGNQGIVWVKEPEPVAEGVGVMWEAKDRTGRLKEKYMKPNVRTILNDIYGEERRKKIYAS
jgi:hypothetical protein